MFEKAIEKLTNEMKANENNSYVQAIGQFLLLHLEEHPDKVEKLLSEDKSILKSLEVAHRYAGTKRTENTKIVALRDDEVFIVVLTYFGCPDGDPIELPPEPNRPEITAAKGYVPTHHSKAASQRKASTVPVTATSSQYEQVSLF